MSDSFDHLQSARPVRRWPQQRDPFVLSVAAIAAAIALVGMSMGPAAADKIKHPIAVFSGLDKITGRIVTFEIATNETVQFGSLQITERVCFSRPPTEAPQTDTFVEVDNIDANNNYKRIFTGWMFAGSPSLHALDHPVYDIWLLRCKGAGPLIATPPETAATETPPADLGKASQAAKPAPKATPPAHETARGTLPANGSAPIEVGPPPGFVPPSDRPMPTQRFYPAAPAPNGDPDKNPNDGF